jgi:hypothetical protein
MTSMSHLQIPNYPFGQEEPLSTKCKVKCGEFYTWDYPIDVPIQPWNAWTIQAIFVSSSKYSFKYDIGI